MTDNINSVDEIFEFAIVREIEANQLYMYMAAHMENPEMQRVCEDFAKEELEHKAKLELEIIKTGRTVSTEMEPPRPASDYILTDNTLPLDMDYKDVLLLGMEKEEATFRIFVNLIPNVQDEHSREVLLALAEEEVKHKLRFETEYNALTKDK